MKALVAYWGKGLTMSETIDLGFGRTATIKDGYEKQPCAPCTVEGCGEFPFDMLRYDSCWPYQNEDAGSLASRRHERDTNIQSRRVVLQGIQDPTKARWVSFNWKVVGMGAIRLRTEAA